MGLALDEPRDGDESFQVNEVPVIMDPFAAKVVKESGGLTIRDTLFGPMAELQGATAGGCG